MNDIFLLYLITRVDPFRVILVLILLAYAIILFVGFMERTSSYSKEEIQRGKDIITKTISYLWVPLVCSLMLVFIPSKDDIIFIYAGTNILDVVKSDETKRVAGKSVAVFEKYLDEYLKEKDKQ